jgi:hypothetical protein
MKLVIGERWFRGGDEYRERLTVEGLEAIEDEKFETGTVVVPINGDSGVKVTVENTMGGRYEKTIPLRELVGDYKRRGSGTRRKTQA